MRGNCANISGRSCSASLNPLVLKRKRKWKRKSLQCSSSTAALMSPCSRRMFVEITWFALVISPVHLKTAVSFRLTAVCEAIGGFISLLFAFRAMLPICRGFFFHHGVFFPLKKWRLHGWCRSGEKNKLSLFHSGEANIHYTTDKSFALNIGWDLNWDNLARTSFIWGRRHCCLEFGISQEQHHPSYLGRGRHLRGLHSGPSGKVNSTMWEVQWKDLMRRPCWRQWAKK